MRRLSTIIGPALNSRDNNNNTSNNYFDLANSTPTRPPRSSRAALKTLQPREHNAMMRVTPKSPLQLGNGNNNMAPHDKPPSRPLMPTLSAAAQKASNRTPFTPRVAGSAPPTYSTPTQPPRPRSQNKNARGERDEILTPVSTFLSHNITPRSGSRKTRVDSTNTTPNGTPIGNVPAAPQFGNEPFRIAQDPPYNTTGLGIGGVDRDTPKRPTVSFSPSVSEVGSNRGSVPPKSADSKFFFASDAKQGQQSPRPPPSQPKNATFFYANGDSIPQTPQSSNASAVGSSMGEERPQPRFLYANGTPDLQPSPTIHYAPPRASSTVSSSSRMTSPRLTNGTPGPLSPTPRPVSPSKLSQNSSVTSLRSQPVASPVSRPQVLGRGQSANGIVAAARANIEVQKNSSHGRSSSLGSSDGSAPVGGSIAELITPSTPLNLMTNSIPVSTPEELADGNPISPLEIHSPTKPNNALEKMNELAANARRERKVLDLEITNSSLEAINRTLEREMRKQTAELRRYRRLSRSGRLSIATTASMRTSTGTLDGEDHHLPSMSEEDSEIESEPESELESDSSSPGSSLSPSAIAESDARHRQRDEQRLQLDLSKHQQLLVDSQKMNESLKRCSRLTEELITEGKKALAYRVRVSDVELGGRVLVTDHEEEEGEDVDENEGMSDIGARFLKEAREKAKASGGGGSPWLMPREDRDSGVEVDEEGGRLL